ncbi:MAG: 4-diphosphocytidyl-2-C-methyl-D-erythritol kinase [Planctomycetota bacterium]|jgi:4-diphosphocytidyl-2-C-methyl-D-erythritol kinase
MPGLVLPAPAKINLVLEILGRREDGFHALETLFQTLELADEVALETASGSGIDLAVEGADLSAGPDNLAWRAAAAYLERRPVGRVRIRLVKRVPHGAGMGGGSSDAAAVLRGLARLDPAPPAPGELAAIALALGSDVPFFLVGGTAHALGRGELLTPLADAPAQAVTVLKPAAGCPTPAVFKALTDPERGPRPPRGAESWGADLAARGTAAILHNRMAAAAARVEPAVAGLLAWLAGRGVPHLLSGSGSACFALGDPGDPPPGIAVWRTSFRPRARLDAVD